MAYVYQRYGFYRAEVIAGGLRDAAPDGKIPVEINVTPGQRFFGEVSVRGAKKLRASFVTKRFSFYTEW